MNLTGPIVKVFETRRKPDFGGYEAVFIKMVDLLEVLQFRSTITFQIGSCSLLHFVNIPGLDSELHVENRRVVVWVLMPSSIKQSLFEVVVLLANKYLIFLQKFVALSVLIPICDSRFIFN